MKNRLIVSLSLLAVFALSIAAFAYTKSLNVSAAGSCCTGDSCPIKKKRAENASAEHKSCCDDCDCCKDGEKSADSCPMMKKHSDQKAEAAAPADHASHKNVVVAKGESCCGCACCGGEKKKAAGKAV